MGAVIRRRLTYANVISTLALFVALGGGAFAATKFVGSGGVVRLCISQSGAVKALKAGQRCGRGRTQVRLNQTGPRGPRGLAGAQGSQGPPGPQGSAASYTAGTGLALSGTTFSADLSQLQARIGGCASDQVLRSVSQAGSPTCVGVHAYYQQTGTGSLTAAVALPAGSWVVIGQETASIVASPPDEMVCNINESGTSIGHASQTASTSNVPISVTPVAFATTTAANTPIQLVCDTGGASTFTPGAAIYAIPVAAVTQQ